MDRVRNISWKLVLLLVAITWQKDGSAQSTISSVVDMIESNNKQIALKKMTVAAEQLSFRTGNAPDNLRFGYDFLKGGLGSGDQTEILVAQAFDFPTVYAKRKQLADARSATTDQFLALEVNDIRLRATKACLNLVYEQKRRTLLDQRRQALQTILTNFEERFSEGKASKLDVGKAKLQLIALERELADNRSQELVLRAELLQLNGGLEVNFNDTEYPVWATPNSDTLEMKWKQSDPVNALFVQQNAVATKEVELSKAMWLPSLEAGFRHVSGFGQLFNGVHTGISIPIWERRNTVKAKKAEQSAMLLNSEVYASSKSLELKRLLQEEALLREMLGEYEKALGEVQNLELLKTALELGRINSTEYFIEANSYYDALAMLLTTELEYQQVQAAINRYN